MNALTPEQIAQIATQAALAAVTAAMGGAQAPPSAVPSLEAVIDADDPEEQAAIESDAERERRKAARIDELVRELLPLLMQERHLIVFDWMAGTDDYGRTLQKIVRQVIAAQTPLHREAMGKGGSSTKSAATMDRLKLGI